MLSHAQITRLLDIAYLACHRGLVLQARTIFSGVLAVQPGHVPALLGMAFSHMVVDDFATAEALFGELRAAHPEDKDASFLLGMTLVLAGRPQEGRDYLEPLTDGHGPRAQVAKILLERA